MRKKQWIGLIGTASLALTMVACGSNNNGNEGATKADSNVTPAESTNASNAESANTTPAEAPKETPKIKLVVSDHSIATPKEDDPRLKYLEEKTGVDLDVEFLPHGTYQDQLKLKFASGEFPDVYQSWSGPEQDLIDGDKILPLNDLIEQFGPNLKKNIPQAAWDAVTQKGQILAIPQPADTMAGQVMFIRKDWLDKLSLPVPTTSDELLNVLRAFRDNDLNGNGEKDEIPFSMRENFSWGENIFGMWGIGSAWTEYFYNNEVIMGNIHPNMLKSLEFFQTMNKEKLIDSEFLTNNRSVWEQKIKAGLVGVWDHTAALIPQWNIDLMTSIPDQKPEVIAIPTPRGTGYEGPVGSRWSPIGKTFIVSKAAKNPEAIIKYFDWLISDEGQIFTSLGIEGDTYFKATADGRITFDAKKTAEISWLETEFRIHGYNPEVTKIKLADDAMFEKLDAAYKIANSEGYANEAVGMPPIADERNMTTMFREAAAKVILGKAPLSEYEKFMEAWRNQGGDDLIKERTDWYNANRK
ncbi:extracellular solute-binding protein [Paenibacillus sp. CF384]|uniref:extracellular solute-binding protein n=1 Tax=Paenibacillus sp. CF384 TaxID=1884382 RepID=UPI00089852E1|nr:extracellular solute-binding protein [Paenibacillus sp. CF384]SDX93055.1 carbohydrate ABC transporter substrate-binding protein, CUT1 family [Paenibacillus sp. CF384]